jgi:hypothetical protein
VGASLLDHWRTVEFWIKRAEQINKQAVIPAINELRYASRQLFNAIRILSKPELTDGDRDVVRRRIIIAQQYLFNADHDISDAIVGFYDILIRDLDLKLGPTAITIHFAEYPFFKQRIRESQEMIAEARRDYDKRGENYTAQPQLGNQ